MSIPLMIGKEVVLRVIGSILAKWGEEADREKLVKYRAQLGEALTMLDNKKRISKSTQWLVKRVMTDVIRLESERTSVTSEEVRTLMRKLDEIDKYPYVMRESDCRECKGQGTIPCRRCNGPGARTPGILDYGENDIVCPDCDGSAHLVCKTCRNCGLGYIPFDER